ncbi:MAG: ferritin-like domain-containing protein [Tistlia sp.]|uniref:ferritin-like domain-containing protein n=1 Tax=Tistlia sp. TaxID=3057121 RepID=UPI0034A41BF4
MQFTLAGAALAVLDVAEPERKVRRSHAIASDWRGLRIHEIGSAAPPDRPARPGKPELKPATRVRKRKIGPGLAGRVALLHALAHIELNAVDLAWDIVARFTHEDLPHDFYDDWVKVADEEAKHFALLSDRLAALGAAYGDLPAHDGLWEAALETRHDLLARLAVVPLVLEARGLDVTPAMVGKLRDAGDADSAAVLQVIYDEEIGHVATGKRWFAWLCERRGLEPVATWQALVRKHFRGQLKRPFNEPGRAEAGLPADWYAPLAGD